MHLALGFESKAKGPLFSNPTSFDSAESRFGASAAGRLFNRNHLVILDNLATQLSPFHIGSLVAVRDPLLSPKKSRHQMTPPDFFSDFGQKITEDGFSGRAAKNAQPSELGILGSPFGGFAGNAGIDFCVFKKAQFRALPGFPEKPSSVIFCPKSEKKSGGAGWMRKAPGMAED